MNAAFTKTPTEPDILHGALVVVAAAAGLVAALARGVGEDVRHELALEPAPGESKQLK